MSNIAEGFLLTRASRNTNKGVEIELWVTSEQGVFRLLCPHEKALFFVPQQEVDIARQLLGSYSFEVKALKLTSFEHQTVSAFYFFSGYQANQAYKELQQHGVTCLEGDIRSADRYLMERFICGGLTFTGRMLSRSGYTEVQDAKVKAHNYQPEFKTVSLDIECSEKGELYSIGLYAEWGEWVFLIGPEQAGPEYMVWVENEKQLLTAFIQWLAEFDPDIIIGWAVVSFDMRLLVKRAEHCGVVPGFGRGGQQAKWRDRAQGGGFLELNGRVVVDGIDALKVATYQFESFSLDNVAKELLGRGKKTDDVANRMGEINYNFKHDKVALAKYNLEDCRLVWEIFGHTHLMDFLIQRTRLTGLELDRAGGSVAAFTNLYLPKLHRAGYVAPNLPLGGGLTSPGGYVMDSKPGLYKNVLVLDFKSLYPSIIRSFKIDPMGLVEGLQDKDNAIPGFKEAYFSRDRHFLPEIITRLWAERDKAKQKGEKAVSQAIKIIMNSFYGVLGSGGCRFYDPRLASSITMRGHEIMKQTRRWIEDQGYEVIYGDTDSTFVLLDKSLDSKQADEIGHRLTKLVNKNWRTTLSRDFALDNYLEMEYETHYRRFLMPTIRGTDKGSKKRYAGTVSIGGKTELVFKGLESVRSDWTDLAREFQVALYKMVFNDEDPREYIKQVTESTLAGEMDSKLVYRKRLRQKLTEYVKNVPPHAKAARLADEQNARLGKPLKYQRKGKICYFVTVSGPEPVEYLSSELDYDHYIQKQIKPIADGILPFIGLNFAALTDKQMGLF